MKGFQNLQAWQIGMDVARTVKRETDEFPRDELFGLTSQLRRAAVSIPSNIAEGSQRHSDKEFRQFVGIARGSCAEVQTLALLAVDFGYLAHDAALHALIDRCARILNGLASSLRGTNLRGQAVAAGVVRPEQKMAETPRKGNSLPNSQ